MSQCLRAWPTTSLLRPVGFGCGPDTHRLRHAALATAGGASAVGVTAVHYPVVVDQRNVAILPLSLPRFQLR